jgi:hypothetical protein
MGASNGESHFLLWAIVDIDKKNIKKLLVTQQQQQQSMDIE